MKDLLKTTLLMANIAVVGIGLQGPATAQVPPSPVFNDSQPGSVLVFPKFDESENTATQLRITNTHDSEYVGVRFDIICPGEKGFKAKSRCEATDVHLRISPHGTVVFDVGPYAPCDEGFVVAIAEEAPATATQPSSGRPISWNYLTGSYHIISSDAAEADQAIAIQSSQPVFDPAAPVYLDPEGDGLQFGTPVSGAGTQDYVPLGTTLYTDFRAGGMVADQEGEQLGSELVLLSLDIIVGAQNPPTLVNINFWNENQVQYSAAVEYVCWTRLPLEEISELFLADNLGTATGSMTLTPAENCPIAGACGPGLLPPYQPVILGAINEYGAGFQTKRNLYHDDVPNSTIYTTNLPAPVATPPAVE
jgi:hypothetical protein